MQGKCLPVAGTITRTEDVCDFVCIRWTGAKSVAIYQYPGYLIRSPMEFFFRFSLVQIGSEANLTGHI